MSGGSRWPALPLAEWRPTFETLHLWAQIVGKTRLALAPMQNHWWQVALYVTSRGLGGTPLPYGEHTLDVDFDFLDHQLILRRSDGATRTMALAPRSVADFYGEYCGLLRGLGMDVRIRPQPCEIEGAIRCDEDRTHASYDAGAAQRCWRALAQADRALRAFRGRFLGKCSPVHFWWGGFDLSCTRFSGRPAPAHPGGIPSLPDWITREAYSHECISAGWWPGGGALNEPAFYAYAYPEPAGLSRAAVRPAGAYYHPVLREFILPYDAVRTAADPDATLTEFLQSTYDAAADLARWDRAALERRS